MKTVFLCLLIAAIGFSSCQSGESGEQADKLSTGEEQDVSTASIHNPKTASNSDIDTSILPKMSFSKAEHDFGAVDEGETVKHTFQFKNTGESELVISNAKASCGCTVPYYPKEPIKPGESEEIEVAFNTKGKNGTQRKAVTITANTQPNVKKLYITANVQKAKE